MSLKPRYAQVPSVAVFRIRRSSVGRLFRHSRLPLWGARTDARCGETDRAILTTTNFKIVHAIIGLELCFEGS